MILCLDCGNTSIKIGLFNDEGELKDTYLLKTDKDKSSDEYSYSIKSLVKDSDHVTGAIISSVVPLLTEKLVSALKRSYKLKDVMVLGKSLKTKMPIKIDNPNELGSDLLAGAIGAKTVTNYPLVVADLGTATKLYVVDKNGAFIGCVISAGLEISLKALVSNTSQLLETSISAPGKVIGKNTVDSIKSGIVNGQAYMVSEFARRMEKELGYELNRVVTGGFSNVVKDEIQCFKFEPALVLKGLYEIYKLNK